MFAIRYSVPVVLVFFFIHWFALFYVRPTRGY